MIDCSLGDSFEVLSCSFWSTVTEISIYSHHLMLTGILALLLHESFGINYFLFIGRTQFDFSFPNKAICLIRGR